MRAPVDGAPTGQRFPRPLLLSVRRDRESRRLPLRGSGTGRLGDERSGSWDGAAGLGNVAHADLPTRWGLGSGVISG